MALLSLYLKEPNTNSGCFFGITVNVLPLKNYCTLNKSFDIKDIIIDLVKKLFMGGVIVKTIYY